MKWSLSKPPSAPPSVLNRKTNATSATEPGDTDYGGAPPPIAHERSLRHGRSRCEQIELGYSTQIKRVEARRARLTVRLRREKDVRHEETLLAVYSQRIDAEQRREPREAAACADEPLRACNGGGLNAQVRRRRQPVAQAGHVRNIAEQIVLVLVGRHAGVEHDDWHAGRGCPHQFTERAACFGSAGQRSACIELRGDIALGKAKG